MSSDIVKELQECISFLTEEEHTVNSMWIEILPPTKYHAETDGPILHVKKSLNIDIEALKSCVEKKKLKAIQLKDEWHVFKPRIRR